MIVVPSVTTQALTLAEREPRRVRAVARNIDDPVCVFEPISFHRLCSELERIGDGASTEGMEDRAKPAISPPKASSSLVLEMLVHPTLIQVRRSVVKPIWATVTFPRNPAEIAFRMRDCRSASI